MNGCGSSTLVLSWMGVALLAMVMIAAVTAMIWSVKDRRRALRYGINPSLSKRR